MKRVLNLSPVNYWTEQPFTNRAVAATISGPPANQPAIFGSLNVPIDSIGSTFVIMWDGGGTITVGPAATVISTAPGRIEMVWNGTHTDGKVWSYLLLTSRAPGQSNFRVIRKDQLAAFEAGSFWRPDFLDDLKGFTGFRAMDWMRINGSTRADVLIEGSLPVIAADGTATIPLALIVDLASRTGLRPWINLPHLVTDAAAKAAAAYLDRNCQPRPIVEYTNEAWNDGFVQTKWLRAQALGSKVNDNNYAYGFRAGQLAKALRGPNIDFVLCGQLVAAFRMANVLAGAKDAGAIDSDFAAIAPATYITGDLVDYTKFPALALGLMDKSDIDGAHANMMAGLPRFRGYFDQWAAIAKARGWKLWAYEGGNFHLNARGAIRDVDKLRQFFANVQQAPRAVETMAAYSKAWEDAGGDMDALYNLASASTIDGFFGLKLQPLIWQWVKTDMAPPVVTPPAEPLPTIEELQALAAQLSAGLAKLIARAAA